MLVYVLQAKNLKAKLMVLPFVVRADDILSKPLPETVAKHTHSPYYHSVTLMLVYCVFFPLIVQHLRQSTTPDQPNSLPNSPSRSLAAANSSTSVTRPYSAPAIHPPSSSHEGHADVFRPSSPQIPQTTLSGTFGSFPKYLSDPYDDKKVVNGNERHRVHVCVYIYIVGGKTICCSSILIPTVSMQ